MTARGWTWGLRRLQQVLGAAFLCCIVCVPALAQYAIAWEVVNRFPLLRNHEELGALSKMRAEYLRMPTASNPAKRVPETLWDPFEQRYERALLDPVVIVELSLAPAPGDASCAWSVDGASLPDRACAGVRHSLPPSKTAARVSVVVRHAGGSIRQDAAIEARQLLIVSLGDSYASGEGVPDVDVDYGFTFIDQLGNIVPRPANWWDQRCHRSLNSGPAQAAMQLAQRNRHVQVIFVSFACSGAEIFEGLLAPYAGRETYAQLASQLRTYSANAAASVPNRPGGCGRTGEMLRDPVVDCRAVLENGTGVIDSCKALCIGARTGLQFSSEYNVGRLPSQLNALLDMMCGEERNLDVFSTYQFDLLSLKIHNCDWWRRPIDALLLSIGGNDIGFGALVRNAVLHGNAFDLDGFRLQRANESLKLAERYRELDAALRSHVAAKQSGTLKVFLTQYPDPAGSTGRDERCGVREDLMLFRQRSFSSWLADLFFYGLSENEIGEARRHVIGPLSRGVAQAAKNYGWRLVDGHVAPNLTHGYCNRWSNPKTFPWTHTHDDSVLRQGYLASAYDSSGGFSTGAMHPNILGYRCYAEALLRALESDLLGRDQDSGSICDPNAIQAAPAS